MNISILLLAIFAQALDLGTSLYTRKFWPRLVEKTVILRDYRGSFSIPKGIAAKVGICVLWALLLHFVPGTITNICAVAVALWTLAIGVSNIRVLRNIK